MTTFGPPELRDVLEDLFPLPDNGVQDGDFDDAAWSRVTNGGFDRILVPEDLDGAGGDLDALAAAVVAAARASTRIPLVETSLGRGICATLGRDVPEGVVTFFLARQSLGGATRLSFSGVPYGRYADQMVVAAPAEGAGATADVLLVDLATAAIDPAINLADEPRDTVTVARASASWLGRLPFDRLVSEASVLRSLSICGALLGARDLSLSYAQSREQFGRQLIDFQAVQELLVETITATELTLGITRRAVDELVTGDDEARRVLIAEAAGVCAQQSALVCFHAAHQVHGALGFTMEHALQLSTRRLLAWRKEYGTNPGDAAAFGRRVVSSGLDALWNLMTVASPWPGREFAAGTSI